MKLKKLTDHNHDKYVTTLEFSRLTTEEFIRSKFNKKTEFDTRLISLNKKINSNKTKHLLIKNKLEKLKTFDLSYFRGKNAFEKDSRQNYLVFQPMYEYLENISNTINISSWKSKEFSNKVIKPPDNKLPPELIYSGKKIYVKFNGSCFKQDKISFSHGKTLNIYNFYALKSTLNYDQDITLEKCFLMQ